MNKREIEKYSKRIHEVFKMFNFTWTDEKSIPSVNEIKDMLSFLIEEIDKEEHETIECGRICVTKENDMYEIYVNITD